MYKFKATGLSLVELLGAVAVIATVATLAVISIKDTVQAGQRSAAQKELQHLNSALQNFRSAGGAVSPTTGVEAVVDLLRDGVDLSGSDFTPLSTDPAMTRDIAGMPYSLEYDDENGFSYAPESGDGGVLGDSGVETVGNTFPFDVNDPAAAQVALEDLALLDPGTAEYNDLLSALNAANMLGTLSDQELADAGLIEHEGQWQDPVDIYPIYAQEAQNLLNGGASWPALSPLQQLGYANTYPELAVALSGASALNLVNPSLLTPALVSGYVLNANTWVAPQLPSGSVNNTTFVNMTSWSSWGTPLAVMRVTDPLAPAELVGYITPRRSPVLPLVQPIGGIGSTGGTASTTTTQYFYDYTAEMLPSATGITLAVTPTLSTSSTGSLTLGGGSGTLGGGFGTIGSSTPIPAPTPTNVSSTNGATTVNFNSTSGGQIFILGPSL